MTPIFDTLNDKYSIEFESLSHSLAKPYQIEFNQLKIKRKLKYNTRQYQLENLIFSAKNGTIELNHQDPFSFAFAKLFVTECSIDFDLLPKIWQSVTVQQISLTNCDLSVSIESNLFTVSELSGDLTNWQGFDAFFNLKNPLQWNLTAKSLQLHKKEQANRSLSSFLSSIDLTDDLKLEQIINAGFIQNNRLYLTQFGAKTELGSFFTQFNYQPKNSIEFNRLQFYNFHYQTTKTLTQFIDQIEHYFKLPVFDELDWIINDLNLTQTDLIFKDLSLEKATAQIKNIAYQKKWLFEKSSFGFFAEHLNLQNDSNQEQFQQLSIKAEADKNHFYFKIISDWQEGNLSILGEYQDSILKFNSMTALNLRYKVPSSFALYADLIPTFNHLDQILIDQIILYPSTILYPSSEFPFEFTQFELSGNHLKFDHNKTNHSFEMTGTLNLSSAFGTLNKVPLIRPNLEIELANERTLFNLTSQIQTTKQIHTNLGWIDINGELTNKHDLKLMIDANAVSFMTLENWFELNYLAKNKAPTTDSYQIELIGRLDNLYLTNSSMPELIQQINEEELKQED